MTDGIAMLSLEAHVSLARRSSAEGTDPSAEPRDYVLRDYVLGPENALVGQGIGLRVDATGGHSLEIEIVPLTLWAPSGLGKSQLLRALASLWSRQYAGDSVLLVSAADFARNYATAIKVDDVPRFQRHFQLAGLLLIDDLDTLLTKPGAQQQLATIIDHRQRHARPIVLTARRPPRSLGLSDRLTSRIASGLVLPIQMPSIATRQRILKQLCDRQDVRLTADAEALLSHSESLTVPQLMGLLTQLKHGDRLPSARRPPAIGSGGSTESSLDRSAELAKAITAKQLAGLLPAERSHPVDAQLVIRTTAKYFGLPQRNLIGSSRRKLDVLARSLAMFVIRELTGSSFQRVGQHFGGRDHTTVLHAYKKIQHSLEADATTRQALLEIRQRLGEATGGKTNC